MKCSAISFSCTRTLLTLQFFFPWLSTSAAEFVFAFFFFWFGYSPTGCRWPAHIARLQHATTCVGIKATGCEGLQLSAAAVCAALLTRFFERIQRFENDESTTTTRALLNKQSRIPVLTYFSERSVLLGSLFFRVFQGLFACEVETG